MVLPFVFLHCFLLTAATKTIIISSDGFRWDYYGKYNTPGLDRIRQSGLQVKNLINSFATVTFPNHYTLVTGLYEESHGIIDNEMYDPQFNETFDMSNIDPKWWAQAEPIWVTAEKNGIKTACVNWVGCAVPHQDNILPSYWNFYNGSIPYEERVDLIVTKVVHGDAELGLLYFEDPDHTCHMFGVDSPQLAEAIERVDKAVQYLLKSVDLDSVNLIFTADHGGYNVSKSQTVTLQDFTGVEFTLAASGAVAHVWPKDDGDIHDIFQDFSRIDQGQATCFLKEDVPARLHYSQNRRIAPIVCIAQLGWTIVKNQRDRDLFVLKGSHGYDASTDDDSPMRPVFIAAGPDLVRTSDSLILPPFENVHVYPLLAKLLGIDQSKWPPINGTATTIHGLMATEVDKGSLLNQLMVGSLTTAAFSYMVKSI